MANRILLKLSGESLAGAQKEGLDKARLDSYAQAIKDSVSLGNQIAIVIGGGNIFRGMAGAAAGFDRVTGDSMGMLATVINSLALTASLEAAGQPAVLFTAHPMSPIGTHYSAGAAKASLTEGKVALIAGGTGNPFFTTDTASVLRAVEIGADLMLKGTRVDGIYTADPEKDPSATRFERISYDEVYSRGLKIMDLTAMTLARDNGLRIRVFNMDKEGNLLRLMKGEPLGTLVENK